VYTRFCKPIPDWNGIEELNVGDPVTVGDVEFPVSSVYVPSDVTAVNSLVLVSGING
jgi:hypothetical protein